MNGVLGNIWSSDSGPRALLKGCSAGIGYLCDVVVWVVIKGSGMKDVAVGVGFGVGVGDGNSPINICLHTPLAS